MLTDVFYYEHGLLLLQFSRSKVVESPYSTIFSGHDFMSTLYDHLLSHRLFTMTYLLYSMHAIFVLLYYTVSCALSHGRFMHMATKSEVIP